MKELLTGDWWWARKARKLAPFHAFCEQCLCCNALKMLVQLPHWIGWIKLTVDICSLKWTLLLGGLKPVRGWCKCSSSSCKCTTQITSREKLVVEESNRGHLMKCTEAYNHNSFMYNHFVSLLRIKWYLHCHALNLFVKMRQWTLMLPWWRTDWVSCFTILCSCMLLSSDET